MAKAGRGLLLAKILQYDVFVKQRKDAEKTKECHKILEHLSDERVLEVSWFAMAIGMACDAGSVLLMETNNLVWYVLEDIWEEFAVMQRFVTTLKYHEGYSLLFEMMEKHNCSTKGELVSNLMCGVLRFIAYCKVNLPDAYDPLIGSTGMDPSGKRKTSEEWKKKYLSGLEKKSMAGDPNAKRMWHLWNWDRGQFFKVASVVKMLPATTNGVEQAHAVTSHFSRTRSLSWRMVQEESLLVYFKQYLFCGVL